MYKVYDETIADDFTIGTSCRVHQLTVSGLYLNGSPPASSELVTFYQNNAAGLPGKVVSKQRVVGQDTAGTFVIPLATVRLRATKTYWVSVQARLDFGDNGHQWLWESTRIANGAEAVYQNPGDGWGTGCTTWTAIENCGPGVRLDFLFEVTT